MKLRLMLGLLLRGSSVRRILLALVLLFPISSDAWAWGDEGHRIICEIAFRLAQPSTRAEIQKLISNDEQFELLQRCLHCADVHVSARLAARLPCGLVLEAPRFTAASRRANRELVFIRPRGTSEYLTRSFLK